MSRNGRLSVEITKYTQDKGGTKVQILGTRGGPLHCMKQHRPHHPCTVCRGLALYPHNSIACVLQRSQQKDMHSLALVDSRLLLLRHGRIFDRWQSCIQVWHNEQQCQMKVQQTWCSCVQMGLSEGGFAFNQSMRYFEQQIKIQVISPVTYR